MFVKGIFVDVELEPAEKFQEEGGRLRIGLRDEDDVFLLQVFGIVSNSIMAQDIIR